MEDVRSPVVLGTRYIVAIFLYLDDDISWVHTELDNATINHHKRKRVEQDVGEKTKSDPNEDGFTFSFFN
jgi:hypothetical protein